MPKPQEGLWAMCKKKKKNVWLIVDCKQLKGKHLNLCSFLQCLTNVCHVVDAHCIEMQVGG